MTRTTQCIAALLVCGGMAAVATAMTTRAEPPPGKYDALFAPIALYPDALVLQILQCSSAPDQITKLNDWIKNNPDVKGTAAQDALSAEGYEPSFVAIVLFPQVVQMMDEKPDWTRDVAKAFAEDRNGVFASIQQLRKQAQSMGNLATSEQQQVETVKTDSGQEVIVIQPANPQVVYVPQYNPQVVYTQPPPPPDPGRSGAVAGLVGFTAGVILGNAIDDDDDYYGCGGWGYRGPAMCEDGWEDFAEHREDMAKDYYEHRENVAAKRGETQANRQEKSGDNQAARQESSAANQAARKEGSSANQAARQESASGNQAARQESASANQGARQESRDSAQPAAAQSTAAPRAEAAKAQRPPADAAARGSAKSAGTSTDRSGTKTSAYSGYQSGTKEREASSRGKSSASKQSSGGSRGGGGGSRGGGGGGRGR